MSKAFIGIDVSKEHSTAQSIDSDEKKLFYLRFSMDSEGFAELRSAIKGCGVNLDDIVVAMESTGCYHINLFCFLCAEGLRCAVVNPLLISQFVQGSLRKTKTDKKDAMTIAQLLLNNEKKLCVITSSQDAQDLRDLARERASQSWMIASLKNDLKRLLQSTFPELETLRKNIYTETMLNFVRQYPSASLIRQAKRKDVDKALICPGEKRKRVQISADDLIEAAKRSVGSAGTAKELIVSEKAPTILYLQEKCEKITEALVDACEATRIEDLEIMKTLDGVKNILGNSFLAERGELSNFKSYKSLIAYMGFDPSTNQSGKHVGPSKISKRGNRHMRRITHLMTLGSIKSDNIFREYYFRRIAEGSWTQTILGTHYRGKPNFMALAWLTRVNKQPAMIGICVNNSHASNEAIRETSEFSVNVPLADMVEIADYTGLVSGKSVDKSGLFEVFYGDLTAAPMIKRCPITMECKLAHTVELPTNTFFIGEIINLYSEERYLTEGMPDAKKTNSFILTMPDNHYRVLGESVGKAWSAGKKLKDRIEKSESS